jgi:ribose transport system substrate-binding protein
LKSKKLIMVMVFILAAVTVLGACGKSDKKTEATVAPVAAAADGKKLYIPVISKGFQHQFWQAVKLGAEKAAKEFNVDITFEGPETEAQVDKQIEMLQAALGKNASAIAFAALDSKAATPLLEKAKAAGIPIVHDQTSRTGVDRRDGFTNRMKEKYPNIKIVDTQYAGGDQLKSTDAAKAIIQAHPNLKGIFGSNEGSAIGVVNAITELKKEGKIVVIGYDSGKAQIDAIRSGLMAGAITQNPIGIGYEAVKAAVEAVKGQTVPKTIDTGFYWYDKTNVDAPEIAAVLYN